MEPVDYIIIAVVAAVIGAVIWYLYRAKKKGAKCIGCPDSKTCSGHCAGCSGCGNKEK